MKDQERKGNATDDVNFTDYMIEKIAAAIRGGEIMGTVKNENIKNDLEQVASLITAAPEMYDALKDLMDALDFALSNSERVPDCIVAVAQDAMEKAEAAQKKARGDKC